MSPGDHETSDRSLRAVGKLVSGHGELELDDLTTSDSATTPAEPHAQDPLQSQALSDHLSSPPSPHASTRIAAADDDDDDDEVQGQGTHSMSRAPLLRGSPATGTGSYGGLPYSLSTSAESSDTEAEEGTRTHKARRSRRKRHGKSGLRLQLTLTHSGDRYGDRYGDRDEAESSQSGEGSGTRARRSRNNESNSSRMSRATTLDNAAESVEGELESGLDSRFTADAGLHTAVAFEPAEDHLPSSASFTDTDSMSDVSDADLLSKRKDRREPADNSPYPQVRASVSPTDNITLSISTPRMWALSVLFAIFGSATNLFFSLRYPSVSITPVIALLLAHPLGWIWDRALKRASDPPNTFFNGHLVRYSAHHTREDSMTRSSEEFLSLSGPISDTGLSDSSVTWKRRWRLWLAQGTWNEKEHCCVYIASNVSFGFAFATDVIVEQTKFYHQDATILYQILLTLSTQILGYAFAGLTRRYLVRPSGMIWPGTLVSTAMFSSLHKEENKPANGWRISRWRFFLIVFFGSVIFYFLPGFLMPCLSYFNVMTWFAPKNVVVANLFGVASGLGLFPMTFDWSQIAYIGSPLVVPFWAALNIVGGLVIVMWIIAPIMYYSNALYSSYMPILSTAVFDNTGKPYDVSKILDESFRFNKEAYSKYSRVYLPITYVLSYALQFAAMASLLTHTICWHGRDIAKQWRASLQEIKNEPPPYSPLPENDESTTGFSHLGTTRSRESMDSQPALDNLIGLEDVHNRLMRRYEDVPMTWYLLTGVVMTAIGIFVVEYYPVYLPWYGLLLALAICAVLFIPIGIVQAITNQHSSIYLICQLICGVVFPGRPVANMVFVTYGYISSAQGLKFTSDLKLGHYMKIPPKTLFTVQLAATLVSSLTQIATLNWMLATIPGICTAEAISGFTCPIARVHFNGSILWGVVGPERFFGPGALYRPLIWAFLIGAVAPIVVWILGRRGGKKTIWRKVNLPVLFGSISWIPPATGLNFSVWAVVCWVFNDVIRRRKREWWKKYTMTLSAALDSGLAVGVVVVFFGLLYPGWDWVRGMKWWGTEVYKQGCDWQACAFREVPEGGRFGPDTWDVI